MKNRADKIRKYVSALQAENTGTKAKIAKVCADSSLYKIDKSFILMLIGLSVSPEFAVARFKYYRLADSRYRLIKHGIPVETKLIQRGQTRYARYSIRAEWIRAFLKGEINIAA